MQVFWSDENETKMFENINELFTEKYLSYPCFDQNFYLQTDISQLGLDAEFFSFLHKETVAQYILLVVHSTVLKKTTSL